MEKHCAIKHPTLGDKYIYYQITIFITNKIENIHFQLISDMVPTYCASLNLCTPNPIKQGSEQEAGRNSALPQCE